MVNSLGWEGMPPKKNGPVYYLRFVEQPSKERVEVRMEFREFLKQRAEAARVAREEVDD